MEVIETKWYNRPKQTNRKDTSLTLKPKVITANELIEKITKQTSDLNHSLAQAVHTLRSFQTAKLAQEAVNKLMFHAAMANQQMNIDLSNLRIVLAQSVADALDNKAPEPSEPTE